MDSKITDPEILKQLAEEARFIESLMELDGTDYSSIAVDSHETASEKPVSEETIEEDIDLVINRDGEYVPYNSDMVLIEHRGYFVEETEVYFVDYLGIDEDSHRIIMVLGENEDEEIECPNDYKELVYISNSHEVFINSEAAKANGYEFKNNLWVKKEVIITNIIDRDKLTFYNDLEEAINKFYPNNWWFQMGAYTFDYEETTQNRGPLLKSIFNSNPYCLIIKFPHIEITNSLNQKHDIEDLYILLSFNEKGNTGSLLYGFRGVYTNIEIASTYSHSHLQGIGEGGVAHFCLGSGPLVEILHTMHTQPFNKDYFSYFLANLSVYVGWESLDGGPYRRIADTVVRNRNVEISTDQLYSDRNSLIDEVSLKDSAISIEYNNETNLLDINFKKLESSLSSHVLDNLHMYNNITICYKDEETDQYFNINGSIPNRTPRFLKPLCKLGNEDIFLQIKNIENKNINYKKVIHPNITYYAKKYLTRRINEYYLKKDKD